MSLKEELDISTTSAGIPFLPPSEFMHRLEEDTACLSTYQQSKLEETAVANWDKFYARNSDKFFHDRHWTTEEFMKLCPEVNWNSLQIPPSTHSDNRTSRSLSILEAGCGVGNLVLPLTSSYPGINAIACDCSSNAIRLLKDRPEYNPDACSAFVCNLVEDDLTDFVPPETVDLATLVFVLSSVHPDKMKLCIENLYKILKPGGSVIFRDYGIYDYAMIRFAKGHKLKDKFYVRQDGTRCYYFELKELCQLFEDVNFRTVSCEYIRKETVNRKKGMCVPRVFVQGRFRKPDN